MNPQKFARIAESLRQYRRAELGDFQEELGSRPVDSLYVDPLSGDAVLNSVLSSNTVYLLGRKGTGKRGIERDRKGKHYKTFRIYHPGPVNRETHVFLRDDNEA